MPVQAEELGGIAAGLRPILLPDIVSFFSFVN